VFDRRVAVGHGLSATDYSTCDACGGPLDAKDRASHKYIERKQCPYCAPNVGELG
jgi:UPF0176 protein